MILDLNSIIYYGAVYDDNDYYPPKKHHPLWWLALENYKVCAVEDIIRKYGYETTDEIEASGFFIPFFQTNADRVLEDFIKNEYPYIADDVRRIYEKRKKTDPHMEYGTAFRIFCEFYENRGIGGLYEEFLGKQLYADAEAWCKKYHIRYKK